MTYYPINQPGQVQQLQLVVSECLHKCYTLRKNIDEFINYPALSHSSPEISNLVRYLRIFKSVGIKLTAFVTILSLIVLPSLKYDNKSANSIMYQYSWFISAAFLSGETAARVVLFCWIVICTAFHLSIIYAHMCEKCCRDICSSKANVNATVPVGNAIVDEDRKYDDDENGNEFLTPEEARLDPTDDEMDSHSPPTVKEMIAEGSTGSSFKTTWFNKLLANSDKSSLCFKLIAYGASLLVLLFNMGIVTFANYVYVYFKPSYGQMFSKLADFSITAFKLFWYNIVIGKWCSILRMTVNLSWLQAMWLRVFLFIYCGLMVPIIATMLSDSSCFVELLISPQPVTAEYSFRYCINVDPSLQCIGYSIMKQSIDYIPPFIYNNGCSSAILKNYIHILIYTYCFNTVFTPLCFFLFSFYRASQISHLLRKRTLPGALWPLNAFRFRKMLRLDNVMAAEILHLTTVVTFGFTCPGLAVVAGTAFFAEITTWQIMIGRCLKLCDENPGPESERTLKRLSVECRNNWRSARKCLLLVMVLCSIFFAMFVTDIACDTEPFHEVMWMPIICFLYPGVLYIINRFNFINAKNFIDRVADYYLIAHASVSRKRTMFRGRNESNIIEIPPSTLTRDTSESPFHESTSSSS